MDEKRYQEIEQEIASDQSPVGIDAKKTHVLILAKLESIERRLDRIEHHQCSSSENIGTYKEEAMDLAAVGTDVFDTTVADLAQRGVDVDSRMKLVLKLIETLTDERVLTSLEKIISRVESLESMSEMASQGPNIFAMMMDMFDAEVKQAAEDGIDIDAAMRNGISALLFLGQRITTEELDSLGALLRSDVLHPHAVDVIGRMACSIVAVTNEPMGSVGPLKAVTKLGNDDVKRSTAFLLNFSREFGAALAGRGRNCTTPINERNQS